MPQFAYSARSSSGEKIDGVLDAGDTNALAETLSAQGLMLLRAEARMATNAGEGSTFKRLFGERIKLIDLILFCRQLATLLKAGVPLLRSLRGLEESATNRRFARVLADLQQQLESGRELSASMKLQPNVFNNYMVSTVKVGEVTGRLSEAFLGLYSQLSFERENREAVTTALRYPAFVLATAVAALIAVNIFVIPAFANVYRSFKADLPPITQLLISVSNFFVSYGWLIVGLLIMGSAGFVVWLRSAEGLRFWHGFLLKLPIIGALIHKATLARFTKSFGLALKAGIPIVDALNVAVETSGNVVIGDKIAEMGPAAARGESLVRAARSTGVFTPTVLQMFAVGEETGALDEMMAEIAEHFQREVDYAIKSLGAQIEPIMILVLGAMILIFALGVFLPMWDLSRVAIK
jgi:MSHA biogenesis protein MshG